jgi:uncharacterized membrane protein YjgN (DUF898 family)
MIKHNILKSWVIAWVELFQSIVTILTLGIIIPWWDYKLISYFTKREMIKRKGRLIK